MQVELEQVRLRLRGGESATPVVPTTAAYAGLEYCGSEFEAEMQAAWGGGRTSDSKARQRGGGAAKAASSRGAGGGALPKGEGSRRRAAAFSAYNDAEEEEEEEEEGGARRRGGGRQAARRGAAAGRYAESDEDFDFDAAAEEEEEESDGYEYVDDSDDSDYDDHGRKRKRGGGGGGGGGGGSAKDKQPPFVEALLSLKNLMDALPITEMLPDHFRTPPGWIEEPVEGGRRRKSRWVQRDAEGRELRAFDRRQELEASLEAEAAAAGGVWLGQMVGDTWEIAPKAAPLALTQVLGELVELGVAATVTPTQSGKAQPLYVAANLYFKGEPFKVPEAKAKAAMSEEERAAYEAKKKAAREQKQKEEFEAEYDEMAELEKQRLRNIEKNKELLRQLGLA